jgi:hypothetical protein
VYLPSTLTLCSFALLPFVSRLTAGRFFAKESRHITTELLFFFNAIDLWFCDRLWFCGGLRFANPPYCLIFIVDFPHAPSFESDLP